MTSYDRQSLESAIATDTARGLTFEIHEGDLAYTLDLTLSETSPPNIEAAMQAFLAANNVEVEFVADTRSYIFRAQE